jgi:nucleotide-binding universal stress UspA family protein
MIKRILVATDGSEAANKAYAFAVDIAKKYNADLYVLAVARPSDIGNDAETEAIIEKSKKHYEKILEQLRAQAPFHGVQPHFEVAVGLPAEQIIRHAEQHHADLIVIGHRGKTFIERWRLGSISHRVLQ